MANTFCVAEKDRFHLKDKNIYYLYGTWPKESRAVATLDKIEIPVQL